VKGPPKTGKTTGKIWELCTKLSNSLGRPVTRQEIIVATLKEKINPGTTSTQFGYWRKFNGIQGRAKAVKPVKAAPKAPKAPAPAPVQGS
jgi:hypothetical protein